MKADLTRSTFCREKHYSGVRMQQGRVQVDADWNEQVDIGAYLDETTRIDVIGGCGMPEDHPGFGIGLTSDGSDLTLTSGHAYVDGTLCENDEEPIEALTVKEAGAELAAVVADGRELKSGDWVELSAPGVGPFPARLAAVDLETLTVEFEPALDGDQAGQLQRGKNAVLRRIATYLTQPDFPGTPPERIEEKAGTYVAYLDVWQRHRTALEDGSIREVALGGPDHGTRTQTVWQVKLARVGDIGEQVSCDSLPDWSELIPPGNGLLGARAQPETTSTDPCTIPPGAGYRRLENQLYRVEIHDGGDVGDATFKWSRENGSVVVPWIGLDVDKVQVANLGRDEVLGFAPGNWVELTDDTHELEGKPGPLVRVKSATDNVIEVDPGPVTLNLVEFPTKPKVRRWDDPNGVRKVEVPSANDGFLTLEDGVEVHFAADRRYNTGDYWLVPARTAEGDVEWPEDSSKHPLARPPEGIHHHYCALALLQLDESWKVLSDCRKLFPPLTRIDRGGKEPGVHVVRIGTRGRSDLSNDSELSVRELATGIELICDRDVEPGTLKEKPTCLATLDLPFPVAGDDQEVWGGDRVGTIPLTLNASSAVRGSRILWRPAPVTQKWILGPLVPMIRRLELERLLLHLTLKGNFVYAAADPKLDVDGEAFGLLHNGVLGVELPSGDGRRGGDLELWFWLVARTAAETEHVVIASYLKSRVLTSKAKRGGVPRAISLVADREKVRAELPSGLDVDAAAQIDPNRARETVARLRLTRAELVTVVEEPLKPLADVLIEMLREAEIPIALKLLAVPDLERQIEEIIAAEGGLDLVIASGDAIANIEAARPETFDPEERAML